MILDDFPSKILLEKRPFSHLQCFLLLGLGHIVLFALDQFLDEPGDSTRLFRLSHGLTHGVHFARQLPLEVLRGTPDALLGVVAAVDAVSCYHWH